MNESQEKTLIVSSSPHARAGLGVNTIMLHVNAALLPLVVFAVYAFGLAALLTLLAATLACVFTEHMICRLQGKTSTIGDGSVFITGIIYGLTLPAALPLWMTVLGGVVGVALGKMLFGGLGANPFNPALVGRAFLQAAFPSAMTTWTPVLAAERFSQWPASLTAAPFTAPQYDAVTEATPLAAMKFDHQATDLMDLFLGLTAGSLGETCSLLILLGGLFLILRGVMDWRIPAAMLITVAALSAVFHGWQPQQYGSASFMLFSGGLMLGAFYMATDPVASPITRAGCYVYGAVMGVLVVVIRYWGGMPEGVMYAILFGNALSPLIDRLIQPKVFGPEKGSGHDR